MPEAPETPEVVKWARWAIHHVRQERNVIRRAPLAVFGTAVLLAFGAYFYLKDHFADQITNLQTEIGTLQATIQFQNVRIEDLRQNTGTTARAKPQSADINKYVCAARVPARVPGKQAILLEFGVHQKQTNGLVAYVALSGKYSSVTHWDGPPLRTDIPDSFGGMYGNFGETKGERSYTIRYRTPPITPEESEYIYFQSDAPLEVEQVLYLSNINLLSDPMEANKLAARFDGCQARG